ncbi:hypothetical protein A2Z00_01715 [Candidatus Gottesmanbacteria bacterium RBG_13_45_10]|uniref:Uncharacterized protein n=1 Tax=Candidatus Gottesmanbacteria bacterium RBG_13_45_10 TaxID=1798370 RepID=A0A1F5ZF72_9BACT|nr:MAG: hypothetical protein A2Z00_01715 [Candidatus Gottesmanbacteria bacterium RBG_13_45_10]
MWKILIWPLFIWIVHVLWYFYLGYLRAPSMDYFAFPLIDFFVISSLITYTPLSILIYFLSNRRGYTFSILEGFAIGIISLVVNFWLIIIQSLTSFTPIIPVVEWIMRSKFWAFPLQY